MAASDDFKLKLPSNPCMRSARAPVGPTGQQSCCSTNNCSGYRRRSAHEPDTPPRRSEEHTSELQSRLHLVCRLLLEKKKKKHKRRSVAETQHAYECT